MSYFSEGAWDLAMDNLSLYADDDPEVFVEVDQTAVLERLDGLRKAVESIPPAPPPPQYPTPPSSRPLLDRIDRLTRTVRETAPEPAQPPPDNTALLERLIGEVGTLRETLKPKPAPPLRIPTPKQKVKRVVRDSDGLIQAIVED